MSKQKSPLVKRVLGERLGSGFLVNLKLAEKSQAALANYSCLLA